MIHQHAANKYKASQIVAVGGILQPGAAGQGYSWIHAILCCDVVWCAVLQVALLVILAQIGCYVPASFMALSPYDSLHTRIGTADSIESNASSFMVEMADMAHLMER